jgi:hypothetical protein
MDQNDPVYKRMSRCIRHLERLLEIADNDFNAILKVSSAKKIDNRKRWELLALKEAN